VARLTADAQSCSCGFCGEQCVNSCLIIIDSNNNKTFDMCYASVCVCVCVWGGGLGYTRMMAYEIPATVGAGVGCIITS